MICQCSPHRKPQGSKISVELANFRITELPLLTKPNATARSMTATFDLKDNPLIEFFALGLDAYRLATWTHWLNENRPRWVMRKRLP